jgi:O-antigen/teichoic acid export membrane protein
LSIQKKIAKNATYNFLVKAIGLTFGFVASVVVARYLGPEKYGIYSFVIWFLGMVGLLVNLGIPTTITKYVSEYLGRGDFSAAASIFNQLFRFEIAAGVVVSLLLFFLAPAIAGWYDNPDLALYLRIAALVILPMGLMWLYNGLFFGRQRFDLIALINLIVSPLTLIAFLLVIYSGGEIEWLVAVSAVSNVLLITGYVYFKRAKFPSMQRYAPHGAYQENQSQANLRRRLLKFSAGVFVIVVLEALVWERFGIFFLSLFSTPTEIGFFNVAFIFASRTIILLPGALTGILLPAMSEVYGGGNKVELARVHVTGTRYLAMLSFPLCLGGIAISHQMFPALYGSSFQPAWIIFSILIVGGTVGSVATSSSSLLYGAELQRVVVGAGVLSAVLNIGGSLLLVPTFAARGAALATAVSQVVGGALLIGYAYRSYMKQSIPFRAIFRILSASAVMACAAFALAESIKGWPGLVLALAVSFPIYVLGLFLFRSLNPGDVHLMESFLQRLPQSWSPRILRLLNNLSRLLDMEN